MTLSPFSIPAISWQRRLNAVLAAPGKPTSMMSLTNLMHMLPMIIRIMAQSRKSVDAGFDPINTANPQAPGPEMGVPLGGIGGGSITRGWRGGFRRWQLRPGFIQYGQVFADQFSVFVQRNGEAGSTQVLSAERPPQDHGAANGPLSGWDWTMDPACATYQALFPRAWTTYEAPLPNIRLTCRQLSPVIGHNYRESSLPVAEFRWKIENTGSSAATVGLMFTFQNGDGAVNDLAGGHTNRAFQLEGGQVVGVELSHIHRQVQTYPVGKVPLRKNSFEDPLHFAIAARATENVAVTYRTRFTASEDGLSVWNDFMQDGRLDNLADDRPSAPGASIGAAVAATVQVPAGESREVSFGLSWAMPLFRSGFGTPYLRRYTLFYGKDPAAAQTLARDALLKADDWEQQIVAWQKTVIEDDRLPEWYRMALFNELYYVVDGGTIWGYPAAQNPAEPEIGRFAYLESHEYRFYNTYDVHFYASFAMIMNWPKIELALQRDMAEATMVEYPDKVRDLFQGKLIPRKLSGAVPHDVGLPGEDPWNLVNGYNLHDVNEWKDLNPKFVLQVYRDAVATGDEQFLADLFPVMEAALKRVARFDRDGDGLIENDGFPDQTYDVWSVKGPSAYTGGLWLAALSAAIASAEWLGRPDKAAAYRHMFDKGRAAYEQKLWNGKYYNYDSSAQKVHDSIMADQLAGQWYSAACGLPPLIDSVRACTALKTIFDYNVMRFAGGLAGAVNGMRPDGKVDPSNLQSQEVWSGTTYAVAAAMLQEGLRDEAFRTAYGVYKITYEDKGYWFQTPEAWIKNGDYRSNTYMRPLSIWAMQWALERVNPGAPGLYSIESKVS